MDPAPYREAEVMADATTAQAGSATDTRSPAREDRFDRVFESLSRLEEAAAKLVEVYAARSAS
jgi:hypothetical protein